MKDKKTVFVSGNFNIIHPGHLRLIRFAKECGDHLVVGVNSDRVAGNEGHVGQDDRVSALESIEWVDEVYLIDTSIENALMQIKPDVVVKGKEHEKRKNTESQIVDSYGGKLIFSSGESIFSSLNLLKREIYESSINNIVIPSGYMYRHSIDINRLKNIINKFSTLKICVVGDLIVDEYITCQPIGMSQEEPTIVVTHIDATRFVGGAGVVASHAAGLGAKSILISIVGKDELAKESEKKLEDNNVFARLIVDANRPTTLKQRFRSSGRSLLRINHLHKNTASEDHQNKIYDALAGSIDNIDLIVFSDFNYGCLSNSLINRITRLAKQNGVFITADSQSSSQVGDVCRFKEMDLITPTEHEARLCTRNHEDGLVVLSDEVQKKSLAKNILLKLGEEGMLIQPHNDGKTNDWKTDRIGAINKSPRDVSGAGDSLLIVSSMALALGANIWESACLGAFAASVQVGRVGNVPMKIDEILAELA